MGLPSVFMRVAGCNRTCSYCDTGYQTTPSASIAGMLSVKFTPTELIKTICTEFPMHCRHLVFTGGEPIPYAAQLFKIARECSPRYGTSVETNGELMNGYFKDASFFGIKFVVSPKLSSSGKKSPVVCHGEHPNVYYKFVISNMQDVEDLQPWLVHKYVNDIYIQPVYGSEEGINAVNNFLSSSGGRFKPTQTGFDPYAEPVSRPVVRLSIQVHKVLGLL